MKKESLLLVLLCLLSGSGRADGTKPFIKKPEQAVAIVQKQIALNHIYEGWTTLACLDFVAGRMNTQYVPVTVYEIHNANCRGDPRTSPLVDKFRVNRKLHDIQWQNPITLEWLSYVRFLNFMKDI